MLHSIEVFAVIFRSYSTFSVQRAAALNFFDLRYVYTVTRWGDGGLQTASLERCSFLS